MVVLEYMIECWTTAHTHTKAHWSQAQFQKGQPTPCQLDTCCLPRSHVPLSLSLLVALQPKISLAGPGNKA